MKLLYVSDLIYWPGGKVGEDVTSIDFSQPADTEQFSSNLILIVLYVEC